MHYLVSNDAPRSVRAAFTKRASSRSVESNDVLRTSSVGEQGESGMPMDPVVEVSKHIERTLIAAKASNRLL